MLPGKCLIRVIGIKEVKAYFGWLNWDIQFCVKFWVCSSQDKMGKVLLKSFRTPDSSRKKWGICQNISSGSRSLSSGSVNPKCVCVLLDKRIQHGYKSCDYFWEVFQWRFGKEQFHLLAQPYIASIDQGKIYLQRFFKYKHKIAHIIYIFYKNEYWNNKHGTAQYNINELNITATEIYVWKKFAVSCT